MEKDGVIEISYNTYWKQNKSDYHTMEIVRFMNASFDFNVLSKVYDASNDQDEVDDEEEKTLETRKYLSRTHDF